MDPLDADDVLADCLHFWRIDYDRWWAMSEDGRAFHAAQWRMKMQRESYLAKVRDEVAEEMKDGKGGAGAVGGFMGNLLG